MSLGGPPGEVLEHGGEVHGRASANARGVLALLKEAVDTSIPC